MKVRELIKKLMDYNMNADVDVTANNKSQEFSICFGSNDGEGTPKEEAGNVSFYVDALNQPESAE